MQKTVTISKPHKTDGSPAMMSCSHPAKTRLKFPKRFVRLFHLKRPSHLECWASILCFFWAFNLLTQEFVQYSFQHLLKYKKIQSGTKQKRTVSARISTKEKPFLRTNLSIPHSHWRKKDFFGKNPEIFIYVGRTDI